MQTTSAQFNSYSLGSMRPLSYMIKMSFDKVFDDNIDFFTIGTSIIGGGDVIPGTGGVIQEWDKYIYQDYTTRLISVEWTRQVEPFASVTLAMADLVFDNHDDYFTPGKGSPIDEFILPYRPIRIYAGFGGEVIPVFIGLTEKMPVIDEESKTATFHCIDFLYSLLNRPLTEALMYQDTFTGEIVEDIFVLAGLDSTQLDINDTFLTVPFAYFEKNTKAIDAISKLIQAEQGRLYMDENGVIHFKNRQSYSDSFVYEFSPYSNINDLKTRTEDDIINVVEITGKVREVQPLQKYFELTQPIFIPASSSVDIWADFLDPVTSANNPVYVTTATTSSFTVNTLEDGSGSADATNVTLTSSSLFGKSFKMTFANAAATNRYITALEIYATPAVVIQNVYARIQDDSSVGKYDERLLTIDNDFIGSDEAAESQATMIVTDFKDLGSIYDMDVKGTPALQIDDVVRINLYDVIYDYRITKIINKLDMPAKFTQILSVKGFNPNSYFTIGVSQIGGVDMIRP